MACLDRYAEAFDFSVMWKCEAIKSGVATAGAGVSTLTTTGVDFTRDVKVGMPIYNATRGTYGKVTTVAALVLGTSTLWWTGDAYQIALIGANEVATIETFLRIAAGDINAMRASVNGCSCSVSSDLSGYLRKLNVIAAAVIHNCPCARPNISDQMRSELMAWVLSTLQDIRTSKLELCEGHTGADYPAFGIAQQAWTDWRSAEIIIDAMMRTI